MCALCRKRTKVDTDRLKSRLFIKNFDSILVVMIYLFGVYI